MMIDLITTLTELCKINGASGDESEVRKYIIERISPFVDSLKVNALGCVIAHKKGRKKAAKKVMISAHTDEVGMIVTYINPDGTLKFSPAGGVCADVCAGRKVLVNGFVGGVGTTAYHHLSSDKRNTAIDFSDLYIDIGARNENEAREYVSEGDYAYFNSGINLSESGILTAKAIDDRIGCAIMIKMIEDDLCDYDMTYTFVTQEEVGLRGSRTAAFEVNPDYAIVLEATTASDTPLASGDEKCCICSMGTVISYMDKSTIYDRKLYDAANKISAENNIKCQTKTKVAGGNDSGIIHMTGTGVKTAALSVPCRYLHSPSCTAYVSDMEDTKNLCVLLADFCACGNNFD